MSDPLELLARGDKWYLSAGEGLIWAPPFPVWLDAPGFWDEAHLFEYPLAPLFTVGFVDEAGREIVLQPGTRRWTPAALEVPYKSSAGLDVIETRMVLPGFVLGSEWQLVNLGVIPMTVHAVAWTTAPGAELTGADVVWTGAELEWPRVLRDRDGHALTARLQLALARGTDSWGAIRSDATADHPRFRYTPFWDRWDPTRGGLASKAALDGGGPGGLAYLGVHRAIEIPPGGAARLAVALRVEPALASSAPRADPGPPRKASSFAAASKASWQEYFESVPRFRCSDPYFERYWAYRWYGLRLNGIAPGWGHYLAPTVAEGIADRHQAHAYSAPAHVRELRWSRDPEWARGVLRTFLAHQRPDGSLPASVHAGPLEGTDACHADWGGALLALDAVHPSDAFLREAVPVLERYAEWLRSACDREGSGLTDVVDRDETGQAAGSRFLAVDPDADRGAGEGRLRLKGVDATTYAYRLFRVLARLAPRAGLDGERWRAHAELVATAVRKKMWDARAGMFSDVNAATGRRTAARSAVAFLPYATDLIMPDYLAGFVQHLFDPRQFWKPFPVPSTSGTDPLYDAGGAWKGRRHDAPGNGRVWPMTNSHIAEAIARVAREHLPALRAHLAEFLSKFVRMMFWDGDMARPNGFEHYHPVTGRPSAYRGIDDHQHSWVNDLVVSYVIGLRPAAEGRCVVDPMPLPLDGFEALGLPMQGAVVDVIREADRLLVRVNGNEAARGRMDEPIEVRL